MTISFSKRCSICKKSSQHIKMTCKYCNKDNICLVCLLPELHRCENLQGCISESKDKCERELYKNKCQRRKVEDI
jgi:hypothetical protein